MSIFIKHRYLGAVLTSYALPRIFKAVKHPWPATTSLEVTRALIFCSFFPPIYNCVEKKTVNLDKLYNISDLTFTTALNLAGPYFMIHEGGHALLASLLYQQKGYLKINFTPFISGNTLFTTSFGLTRIGKIFGDTISQKLIHSGGFIASLVYAFTAVKISHKLGESHPNISYTLKLHAQAQLLQEMIYTVGIRKLLSHDIRKITNQTYLASATILTTLLFLYRYSLSGGEKKKLLD